MNKLKIIIGNNTENLFSHSIKSIENFKDDMSYKNIIIVPDKLSLYAEQSIFDDLNIQVYFNLYVMGISKFASLVIKENNLQMAQCTELESKLLVLKAILNVKDQFKCFSKNCTLGFVDEIYAKIEQIKSSNCNICDLVDQQASLGTKLKFEDLALIYNEYEKLRNGKLDSGDLLKLFNNVCLESDYLKNCNVFFVGFDSLTKQGLQVLKNVVKCANYVQISVVAPHNQNNSHIYDQSFLDSVINMAKEEKFECETEWQNLPFLNKDKNNALCNLFSRRVKFNEQNFFKLCSATSWQEEIELCTKQINYMLKKYNLKFSDFAVCCNQSYHTKLTTNFANLGIDTYCDNKYSLFSLEPVKYVYSLFSYILTGNEDDLCSCIINDFCPLCTDCKNALLSLLKQYGSLNSVKKFCVDLNLDIEKYLSNVALLKQNENYFDILKNIVNFANFEENINQKCQFFEQNGEILLNKVYLQIAIKFNTAVQSLENLLQFNTYSAEDFLKLLQKVLTETEISSVPSTTNQVFVGDTKSFYFGKKYVFVLGLNEGELPVVLNDYGLISDKEITSPTIVAKLEPTTKIINKRNKFKLFEILLSARENCFIYYHTLDTENKTAQKSEFISELEKLFPIKEVTSAQLKIVFGTDKTSINKLCFNLQDVYNANLYLRESGNAKTQGVVNFALLKCNKLYFKPKKAWAKVDFAKLFFKDNKASISIIEKYNSCPKSAFLANALKLQPIKNSKVEANLIGTFIHEIGEKFVRLNLKQLGKMQQSQIDQQVEEIVKKMQGDENYYSIMLPENNFLLKMLICEGKRFCSFINGEQAVSKFKPAYTEKKFGTSCEFKPITIYVGGQAFTISGIVDRIDFCGENFRIIDYKTGNVTNSKGVQNLYYGTKIQLFVYAKAISNNLNKKLFGAFYLPIKNKFSADGQEAYSFSGFFEDNPTMVMMADSNFGPDNPKSSLLNVTLAKIDQSGELKLRKKVNITTAENLQSLMDYAVEIVKRACEDIIGGYIDCSPMKDKCKFCEFKNLCKNAENPQIERHENVDVQKEKFLELNNGKRSN